MSFGRDTGMPSDKSVREQLMQAHAVVRVSSGECAVLYPGDVIGRTETAALVIDDPRVSEGHAMVSFRKGALWLLSLRRMLRVDTVVVSEIALTPGLAVELADGLTLCVDEVYVPAEIIAVESAELGRRSLAPVSSIIAGRPPRLVARYVGDADAHIWTTAPTWRVHVAGESPRSIALGDRFTVGGSEFWLCTLASGSAINRVTDPDGGVRQPLRITAAYDTVKIEQHGRPLLRLTGIAARLVSELVIFKAPVQWQVLAREVWSGDIDPLPLRHRLDSALHRLRRRLRDAGIRRDFVATDGGGQVWLMLTDQDTVDDQT